MRGYLIVLDEDEKKIPRVYKNFNPGKLYVGDIVITENKVDDKIKYCRGVVVGKISTNLNNLRFLVKRMKGYWPLSYCQKIENNDNK